jgi:hypothetical protein
MSATTSTTTTTPGTAGTIPTRRASPPGPPRLTDEAGRRRALAAMRRRATGLLVVMTVVFVVARGAEEGGAGWIGYGDDARQLIPAHQQGNTERRMQTVRMIDRLCSGIVIKNSVDRAICEINDFFDAAILRHELPTVPCRRVWVRPYSFLGTPQVTGWGAAEDLAINKAFLSYMWTRSMEDLLTDTPVPDDDDDDALRANAVRITKSSAKHAPNMRSFEKVFVDEVGGLIDEHRAEISHAFRPYAAAMLRSIGAGDHDPARVEQDGLNLTYTAAAAPKAHIALPFIRIMAGLHAFIRWQRQRAFTFNDIFDLRHAAAAIPRASCH